MKASKRLLASAFAISIATANFLVASPASAKKEKHDHGEKTEREQEEHSEKKKRHYEEQTESVNTTTTVNTVIELAGTSSCGCSTFVNAVQSAGLTQLFSNTTSSYTLFVPSNEAFAALPAGTLQKLLRPENRVILQQILSYHVLSGTVDYKKIKAGKIKTYGGQLVEIKFKKGYYEIGKGKFKKANLKAKNGYIHVIDTVLIPPGLLL